MFVRRYIYKCTECGHTMYGNPPELMLNQFVHLGCEVVAAQVRKHTRWGDCIMPTQSLQLIDIRMEDHRLREVLLKTQTQET